MRVDQCQVCRSRNLSLFLDLGPTALANSFLTPERLHEPEPTFPLRLLFCEQCSLVQIDEQVAPETLFKHYLYVSGTSDLIYAHAANLASRLVTRSGLKANDLVVEAASNDGTVLKAFQKCGVRTLGIDPAANIVEQANRAGVETVCDFFTAGSAAALRDKHGPAKLVLARHVLAHVADLHGFVRGFNSFLDRDGLAVVEVPYLRRFHEKLEYDTVYHEHLCYFSLRVLRALFEQFDLEVVDALEVPIHGGSIVVTVQRRGGGHSISEQVVRLLRVEDDLRLHRLDTWHAFAQGVAKSRASLRTEIDRLRCAGKTLAGYGAPAKGMTLLSYCGIGRDQVPYLVDKNPLKQGLFTPGHHIPVTSPERLTQDRPDVLLILAWNFADEIVKQQAAYEQRGGRFLLPIPFAQYHQRAKAAA